MKKILTLFAMLLVTASTLLAQAPKLSYQMVVRDQNNNLVVNTEVEGTFTVTDTADHYFRMPFSKVKTNHNGMLSLVVECPRTSDVCGLDAIKWNCATISVSIPAYEIETNEAVLPVPYALMAQNQDVDITTAQIVKYLKQVDTTDFEAIIAAMYGNSSQNPTLEKYLVDTVLNYIKANKTAVRNMMLNWLSQMNANDLDTVYKIFNANTDVKNTVNGLLVDFVEQHPQDVKDVVYFYIDHTTKGDVKAILDAVKDNPAFDTIADVIADTAIKYIKANPAKVQNVVEYYINQATPQQVDHLQSYAKNKNPETYNYVDSILDAMIQHYLDSLHYINNADCQEANICFLLENIETLENSEFVQCPKMSAIDTTRVPVQTPEFTYVYTLKNTFSENIFNVNMNVGPGPDSLIYVFSYPNTTSKADTLYAKYHDEGNGDSSMDLTLAFDSLLEKGQVINVYAVARARCMEILKSQTVTFNFPKQCPRIDTAWNTHPIDGNELLTHKGVELAATINFNYEEKVADHGFLVTTVEGALNDFGQNVVDLDNIPDGVEVILGGDVDKTNTFKGNLTMKYCARKVYYKAFVGCKVLDGTQPTDTTYQFSKLVTIDSVRGPAIELVATPTTQFRPFDDSIKVRINSYFTIASYTSKPTQLLEDWVEMAKTNDSYAEYRDMLDTMYYWFGASDTTLKDSVMMVAPKNDTTVTGNATVKMFNSACTVTGTIQIKTIQQQCNDTIIVNEDTLFGPRVEVTPDEQHASDTMCHGTKDTIVLRAASYIIDKDNTKKALKDIMKKAEFYNGLVDTFSYEWISLAGTVYGNADTLKVSVKYDSTLVCRVNIKYKNNFQCSTTDTILVHYQYKCGDSLRTSQNKYATIDINGYCWTKSNMRETVGFNKVSGATVELKHGDQTGDITNSEPKYYVTSNILANRFSQEQLGYLYNHDAAEVVCPKGWHLPDTMEWQTMLRYVDTLNHQAKHTFENLPGDTVMRTTLGSKIAVQNVWPYYANENPVGFDAYPAGARQINSLVPQDGLYESKDLGVFWSATKSPRVVTPKKYYVYYLYPATYEDLYVFRDDANYILGFSVRCVNDTVPEVAPVTETCPSTVTDRNNNQIEYATVKIGNQCWMKENLRTNPDFSLEPTTGNNPQPACTYPGGSIDNVTVYGLLYNYPAATSSDLCPEGWRLPTQVEFETLMANVDLCGNTPNYVAKALADNGNVWNQANDSCLPGNTPSENNASGFSARPAGWWNNGYDGLGHGAAFWVTPTATDASNYRFYIENDHATINAQSVNNHDCLSVRCIKAEN